MRHQRGLKALSYSLESWLRLHDSSYGDVKLKTQFITSPVHIPPSPHRVPQHTEKHNLLIQSQKPTRLKQQANSWSCNLLNSQQTWIFCCLLGLMYEHCRVQNRTVHKCGDGQELRDDSLQTITMGRFSNILNHAVESLPLPPISRAKHP